MKLGTETNASNRTIWPSSDELHHLSSLRMGVRASGVSSTADVKVATDVVHAV